MRHIACLFCVSVLLLIVAYLFVTKRQVWEGFETKHIPRVIYQTCPGQTNDPIPEEIERHIERIKHLNPGWRYEIFRDNDIERFIQEEYGKNMLDVYRSINPSYGPARADLFRYLLIYKRGGVYFDIKSGCTKPLDDVIKSSDECILATSCKQIKGRRRCLWTGHKNKKLPVPLWYPSDGEFMNWFLISRPSHPILARVIEDCVRAIRQYSVEVYGVGKMAVLMLTGPLRYTDSILHYLEDHPETKYTRYDDFGEIGLKYKMMGGNIPYHRVYTNRHYKLVDEPVVLR